MSNLSICIAILVIVTLLIVIGMVRLWETDQTPCARKIVVYNQKPAITTLTPPLFNKYQNIIHVCSGVIYTIVGMPEEYTIWHTDEPAYIYRAPNGAMLARSQSEIEDGSFIAAEFKENNAEFKIVDTRVEDKPVTIERRNRPDSNNYTELEEL